MDNGPLAEGTTLVTAFSEGDHDAHRLEDRCRCRARASEEVRQSIGPRFQRRPDVRGLRSAGRRDLSGPHRREVHQRPLPASKDSHQGSAESLRSVWRAVDANTGAALFGRIRAPSVRGISASR